jgi:hypothetical protein
MGSICCCQKRDPKLTRLITSNAVIASKPVVDVSQPLLFPNREPFKVVSKPALTPPGDPPAGNQLVVSASTVPGEEEEEERDLPPRPPIS